MLEGLRQELAKVDEAGDNFPEMKTALNDIEDVLFNAKKRVRLKVPFATTELTSAAPESALLSCRRARSNSPWCEEGCLMFQ